MKIVLAGTAYMVIGSLFSVCFPGNVWWTPMYLGCLWLTIVFSGYLYQAAPE